MILIQLQAFLVISCLTEVCQSTATFVWKDQHSEQDKSQEKPIFGRCLAMCSTTRTVSLILPLAFAFIGYIFLIDKPMKSNASASNSRKNRQKWIVSLKQRQPEEQKQQEQGLSTKKNLETPNITDPNTHKKNRMETDTSAKANQEKMKHVAHKSNPNTRRKSLQQINSTRNNRQHPAPLQTTTNEIKMTSTSNLHPGLSGFQNWCTTEGSLYRLYGNEKNAIPPFLPRAERGNVQIELAITNHASCPIDAFWIDYIGNEKLWCSIQVGHTVHQMTWIGHPWTFRKQRDASFLMHYIPYRITPTTEEVPTISSQDPHIGQHKFTITDPSCASSNYCCGIVDPIYPLEFYTIKDAVTWTLQQLRRTHCFNTPLLLKYLQKILLHPDEIKYRRIRIANSTFQREIYNTAARGILLALAFQEYGAYMELGCHDLLSKSLLQEISTVVLRLEQWHNINDDEKTTMSQQPSGADGYGRQGFGRAGHIN